MTQALAMVILAAIVVYLLPKEDDSVDASDDSFTQFDALFQKYGTSYGVSWRVLKAIAMNESSLGQNERVALGIREPANIEGSKSEDGKSWGLMQLTVPTASDFVPDTTPVELNDPDFSIRVAAQFIAWIQKQFPLVDPRWQEWVIKSYNQGVGNTNKERAGRIDGYAGEYWSRFQRNLNRIS